MDQNWHYMNTHTHTDRDLDIRTTAMEKIIKYCWFAWAKATARLFINESLLLEYSVHIHPTFPVLVLYPPCQGTKTEKQWENRKTTTGTKYADKGNFKQNLNWTQKKLIKIISRRWTICRLYFGTYRRQKGCSEISFNNFVQVGTEFSSNWSPIVLGCGAYFRGGGQFWY